MEDGRTSREERAIARARAGDVAAWEEIVATHGSIAFRTAWLVVRDEEEAREAAQDAFVKAYRALGRFRPGAPLRPWLLRIVANEARNRRRAAGRRAAAELRVAHAHAGAAEPRLRSPEDALLAAERRRVLAAALASLPRRERLALELRYVLDLSEADTAAALGVRPGTVKSRLARGLARLRERMADDDA